MLGDHCPVAWLHFGHALSCQINAHILVHREVRSQLGDGKVPRLCGCKTSPNDHPSTTVPEELMLVCFVLIAKYLHFGFSSQPFQKPSFNDVCFEQSSKYTLKQIILELIFSFFLTHRGFFSFCESSDDMYCG